MVALVEADLLLLHDHLLVLEVYHPLVDLLQFVVLVHQHRLLLYPLAVQLVAPLLEFLALAEQVDEFVLVGVLALIVGLAHELIVEFVEAAHLVLLLLVDVVALLDLHLVGDHQVLLVVLLGQRLLPLLLQQLDLRLCVQLVDPDPRDLVVDVLQLDLLLLDV